MMLQMISIISSLTPITTSIPLIGVLTITAIKDAYDDYVCIARIICYEMTYTYSDVQFSYVFIIKIKKEKKNLMKKVIPVDDTL